MIMLEALSKIENITLEELDLTVCLFLIQLLFMIIVKTCIGFNINIKTNR